MYHYLVHQWCFWQIERAWRVWASWHVRAVLLLPYSLPAMVVDCLLEASSCMQGWGLSREAKSWPLLIETRKCWPCIPEISRSGYSRARGEKHVYLCGLSNTHWSSQGFRLRGLLNLLPIPVLVLSERLEWSVSDAISIHDFSLSSHDLTKSCFLFVSISGVSCTLQSGWSSWFCKLTEGIKLSPFSSVCN